MVLAMNKAVFLDRDGTLIEDCHYLSDPDKVRLLPYTAEGLRLLRDEGFLLLVVSNQSGIGRGYFSIEQMQAVNARMEELLDEQGITLDAVYFCPHTGKETPPCNCRKPAVGMAKNAQWDFSLDLTRCYMVGDKLSDMEFARCFQAKAAVALQNSEYADLRALAQTADFTACHLLAASRWIVQRERGRTQIDPDID